jgi:hypothetical protein
MGGKALKNTFTERKTTQDFIRISNEIKNTIEKTLGVEVHVVKAYHQKETHGDLDLLLHIKKPLNVSLVDYIKETFTPFDIYNNGGVVSFDYEAFQIDLIPIKTSIWEVAKDFFDYDPTGNLMGKIAHKFGLKYGFQGLVYPLRNFNGRLNSDILISRDSRKIFTFLGLDYDRYLKGFETIEDTFKYIIESEYFNASSFDMENLTADDRKRNRKRNSYQEFLSYIDKNNIRGSYPYKSKSEYIQDISNYFPESMLIEKLEHFKKIDNENQEISQKFNGHLIMKEYPNLKGKELGYIMDDFKKQFVDFREIALSNTSESIMNIFKDYIKNKN